LPFFDSVAAPKPAVPKKCKLQSVLHRRLAFRLHISRVSRDCRRIFTGSSVKSVAWLLLGEPDARPVGEGAMAAQARIEEN